MREAAGLFLALSLVACKGNMEKLGDQISAGDVDLPAPRCKTQQDAPKCLEDGAKFFAPDAKFDEANPDQASAAAVALLVLDGHASWVGEPAAWLASAKLGKGAGGDALRLALGRRLTDSIPSLGHKLDADADARKLLAAVAAGVPGACSTYGELGAGADPDAMTPESSPDHSSCVQKDLMRGDGPGGAYGFGLWRAAAAGLAVLKEAVRALDLGAALMTGSKQATLTGWVAKLKPAVDAIELKKVDRPVGNRWQEGDHK